MHAFRSGITRDYATNSGAGPGRATHDSVAAPLPSFSNALISPYTPRHSPRPQRSAHPLDGPPLCPRARFTVALPRANPTPRPLVPLDLNMGAFLSRIPSAPLVTIMGYPVAKLIPQHIRHNEKPDVASPDVDLVQMAHAAVARGDGDVL